MTCSHCTAVEQRGRFCVGCGKLMPPAATLPRRVRVAPRPPLDDDTQPVLRFRVNGRPLVHAAPRHATPRHATPRHATPRQADPRPADPRPADPRPVAARETAPAS